MIVRYIPNVIYFQRSQGRKDSKEAALYPTPTDLELYSFKTFEGKSHKIEEKQN
jgi:hypothetical protein